MSKGGLLRSGAGLLVLAGMLLAQPRLAAHALGGISTLTLSPAHGKANFTFSATYAIAPCQAAAGLTITFSWGALGPAGRILGTAATDGSCQATLKTTPPATIHPGSYQVFGYVAVPTGTPTPNTEASASYTVDSPPPPTASSSATAGPAASSPGNTAVAPSAAATDGAGLPVVFQSTSHPLWWKLYWTAGRRALVLALSVLAVIAFLAARMLRRRRTRLAAALRKDRAA
jgi:hypothetical protein